MRNSIQLAILALIGLSCGGIVTVLIDRAREAADRMSCRNNLRQIALAAVNYTSAFGRFPLAAEVDPRFPHPIEPPEKRLSWLVEIFPYIEASQLYNKISHDKSWDAEENRFAALFDIRLFRCPGCPPRIPDSTFAPTHYIGIIGIGDDAIALSRDHPRAGILGWDREVKITDLMRGTSETALIVETSQASGAWTAAGWPTVRGLQPHGSPYFGQEGQFGGNHHGGVNIGFADGSVRFTEQWIDPAVWEAMATLSGKGNQE